MILENINLTEVNLVSEQLQTLKVKMETEQNGVKKTNILCLIKLLEKLREILLGDESLLENKAALIQEINKVNNRTPMNMDLAGLAPPRLVGERAPVIRFSQSATNQLKRSRLTSGSALDGQPKEQTLAEMREELASLEKYASDELKHNSIKLETARYQAEKLKLKIQEYEARESARIEKALKNVLHR